MRADPDTAAGVRWPGFRRLESREDLTDIAGTSITAMAGGHAVVLTGDPNGINIVFAAQAARRGWLRRGQHTSGVYLRVAAGRRMRAYTCHVAGPRHHALRVGRRSRHRRRMSASDRAWTIAALASATSVAADFQRRAMVPARIKPTVTGSAGDPPASTWPAWRNVTGRRALRDRLAR